MNFKRVTSLVLCAVLVVLLSSMPAKADFIDTLAAQSDYPELVLTGMRSAPPAKMAFQPYNQETVKALRKEKNFAAFYGEDAQEVPAADMEAWINHLRMAIDNVKLDKYLYPQGPVIALAVTYQGVIRVTLHGEPGSVPENLIKQIHQRIASEAVKKSKKTLPIYFEYGEMAVTTDRRARIRPLISGIQADSRDAHFTLGFAALRVNILDLGYTTPTHAQNHFHATDYFQPRYEWWRPRHNWIGQVLSSRIGTMFCDTTWSPWADVSPHIYITSTVNRLATDYYDPQVGDVVWKSGITTNVSAGIVTAFVPVMIHPSTTFPIYNQYELSITADAGDSGSTVYIALPNTRAVIVGMVWGKNIQTHRVFISPVSGIHREIKVFPYTVPLKIPRDGSFTR
jgi:hypothetical protein